MTPGHTGPPSWPGAYVLLYVGIAALLQLCSMHSWAACGMEGGA